MTKEEYQEQESSYSFIRQVMDACADCDTCRFLMDESCLFFPELYRLYDRKKQTGARPTEKALHRLADMCTLCGLCPCPDIRAGIVRAKAARVREKGMPIGVRMLADLQNAGKYAGRFPALINQLLRISPSAKAAKRFAGIAEARRLPLLPAESFFARARRNGLNRMPDKHPKAAYFAGCTAGYLFPEVAGAAVAILKKNGIAVYVPPQQCCGMPTLVEGAEKITRSRVQHNLQALLDAADSGCDIVCSCPTCGFFMKVLLKEGAFYSRPYQESVNAGDDEIRIPDGRGGNRHVSLQKAVYGKILKDDSCFSDIDPLARISLSEKIRDMGQYLDQLHDKERLDTKFNPVNARMAYFAPCHQREQDMGSPYEKILALVPGLEIKRAGGAMDCCGMGGSLGFKESFHEASIRLGRRLAEKIRAAAPEAIVTDCLSCRLQFRHLMPEIRVFHPLEILQRAYEKAE
ncbi:MAG: heterodisulfide reductase-related iron-sulfur binding cluster [Desulfobacterales bacterium]|nr:heterodisulfide reductase-related iron-sulfur binding cluster [Desulfobacterales bacterium]